MLVIYFISWFGWKLSWYFLWFPGKFIPSTFGFILLLPKGNLNTTSSKEEDIELPAYIKGVSACFVKVSWDNISYEPLLWK